MSQVRTTNYRQQLTEAGVQPSAPRLAIASFVMCTDSHPSAEEVKVEVEKFFPTVSLATVYNTLNLFVEKGLLQAVKDQATGHIRYDCNLEPHFHFQDEESGQLYDLPASALKISKNSSFLNEDFDIREMSIVLKGTLKGSRPKWMKQKSEKNK